MRKAARITDAADCHGLPVSNATVPWGGDVLISGVPATRYLDKCACEGFVISSNPTVLIGGCPAARIQDKTSHGGKISSGDSETLLGEDTFESQSVNDQVNKLLIAREVARKKALKAKEEERAYEHYRKQSREGGRKPPTVGPGGLPQAPEGTQGEKLGNMINDWLQHRRMQKAENEAKAAKAKADKAQRDLESEMQRRLNQRPGT